MKRGLEVDDGVTAVPAAVAVMVLVGLFMSGVALPPTLAGVFEAEDLRAARGEAGIGSAECWRLSYVYS